MGAIPEEWYYYGNNKFFTKGEQTPYYQNNNNYFLHAGYSYIPYLSIESICLFFLSIFLLASAATAFALFMIDAGLDESKLLSRRVSCVRLLNKDLPK